MVEPIGSTEDYPNVTNKRFLGNPTKSYRSRSPFRVIGGLDGVIPPTDIKKCAITLRTSSNVVSKQLVRNEL
jgi:hypothetical protein